MAMRTGKRLYEETGETSASKKFKRSDNIPRSSALQVDASMFQARDEEPEVGGAGGKRSSYYYRLRMLTQWSISLQT